MDGAGRLPPYGNPDPKTLPTCVSLAFDAAFLLRMIVFPGAVAFLAWRLRRRLPRIKLIAPIALALLAWTLLFTKRPRQRRCPASRPQGPT